MQYTANYLLRLDLDTIFDLLNDFLVLDQTVDSVDPVFEDWVGLCNDFDPAAFSQGDAKGEPFARAAPFNEDL